MRILHIDLEPWDSGITNYALIVSQGLKESGQEVWFAGLPDKFPLQQAAKSDLNICPVSSIYALSRCLKKIKPDLVVVYTGRSLFWAFSALLLTRLKATLIRTYADARLPRNNFFNRWLYQNKVAKIITAAGFLKESFLKDLRINSEKIVTVYEGVDTEKFTPHPYLRQPVCRANGTGRGYGRQANPLPQGEREIPRVGIVGRLDPIKGHRYFLEAAALIKENFPSIEFVIAGEEKNVKRRQLKEFADKLGVGRNVNCIGYHPDISSIMNSCSLGVVASLGSEAVSRALLEWMACGRPVVATSVGCIPEIIKDGENGFIIPSGDSRRLAEKILFLLKNPDLVKTMGEKNRRLIVEKFSQKIFIENIISVYQQVVAKN